MGNTYTKTYSDILSSLSPYLRSIPNETLLAAQEGKMDRKNERLNERIYEIEDFPPITPLTNMYWVFLLKTLCERSPLIQHLKV